VTTRRCTGEGDQLPPSGAVRATTTPAAGSGERVPHLPPSPRRPVRTPDSGPGVIEQLRKAAVYVETAAVLERRAGRADDPALAALLRERAEVRRRTAEQLRAALAEAAPLSRRRPSAGWEWS
jgi:hypothetical protein